MVRPDRRLLLRSELGQRALAALDGDDAPPRRTACPSPNAANAPPPIDAGRDSTADRVRVPTAYAGRPLLVNFWASWCGPCIEEMPELQRFAAEQAGNGVQVVGIALDDAAAVRAFLASAPRALPDPARRRRARPMPACAWAIRKGVLPYSRARRPPTAAC